MRISVYNDEKGILTENKNSFLTDNETDDKSQDFVV